MNFSLMEPLEDRRLLTVVVASTHTAAIVAKPAFIVYNPVGVDGSDSSTAVPTDPSSSTTTDPTAPETDPADNTTVDTGDNSDTNSTDDSSSPDDTTPTTDDTTDTGSTDTGDIGPVDGSDPTVDSGPVATYQIETLSARSSSTPIAATTVVKKKTKAGHWARYHSKVAHHATATSGSHGFNSTKRISAWTRCGLL